MDLCKLCSVSGIIGKWLYLFFISFQQTLKVCHILIQISRCVYMDTKIIKVIKNLFNVMKDLKISLFFMWWLLLTFTSDVLYNCSFLNKDHKIFVKICWLIRIHIKEKLLHSDPFVCPYLDTCIVFAVFNQAQCDKCTWLANTAHKRYDENLLK